MRNTQDMWLMSSNSRWGKWYKIQHIAGISLRDEGVLRGENRDSFPLMQARIYFGRRMNTREVAHAVQRGSYWLMRAISTLLMLLLFINANADTLQVNINGLSTALNGAAENNLSLLRFESYALASPNRLYLLYTEGAKEIAETIQPFGYYQPIINSHLTHDVDKKRWIVSYDVQTGPVVKIESLNIQIQGPGQNNPTLMAIVKRLPLQIGMPARQDNYELTKNTLENTALANGYFDAKLTEHTLTIDLQNNTASIALTLDTGQQYVYGNIAFQQQQLPYANGFLNRFLQFKPGEPYQSNSISELQNNLNASGYFNSVLVAPKPNSSDKTVPVTISLQSKKSQQYTIGAGYGTDTKFRGLLGWELRRITDTGQKFSAQIEASAIYNRFVANYIIPGKNPNTDYTNINGSESYITVTPYTARQTAFGVDYTQQIGIWLRTLSLHQYYVQYLIPNDTWQSTHYLLPSVSGYLLKMQDAGYWQKGYSLNLSATGSVTGIESEFTFLQATGNFNYSFPLSDYNRILWSVHTGGTQVNSLDNLPPMLRFYAGGIDNVRGYSYLSLGPTENGVLVGGQYLLTSNLNFEQHLFGNWSGIIFYDIGNAFNDIAHMDGKSGAGVGLSWKSPIGPIRLFLSNGLNAPGEPWRIDFSIGAIL